MVFHSKFFGAIACASALALSSAAHASPMTVDLELQLLVDVSGSVDDAEFILQRTGYSDAFRSQAVKNAIANGPIGSIAVQLIYWSQGQAIAVDWMEIASDSDADDFADLIDAAARPNNVGVTTGIGSVLNFGAPLFDANDFDAARQVIDISGDGRRNTGASETAARDAALAGSVDTINALAIEDPTLEDYFIANVIGGDGAFAQFVEGFDDFGAALITKLVREIDGVIPVPGALPLMLTGLGLVWAKGKRRKA